MQIAAHATYPAIPVNPCFPTPELFETLRSRLERRASSFTPARTATSRRKLAELVDLDPETLVIGNGSTELISFINRLLVTHSLAIPVPTFSRWTEDPR